MAKFCTKCGKPLKEGQICSCKEEEKNDIKKVSKTEIKEKVEEIKKNEFVNELLDLIKGIFLKPVTAVINFSKESNFILGIILISLSSILIGLFGTILVDKTLNSFLGMFSYGLTGSLGFSFFKTFISLTFISLVVSFAVSFFFDIFVGKVFKGNSSLKKMIACYGAICMLTSMIMVAAILFTFISIELSFIILLIGSIYSIVLLISSIKQLTDIENNNFVYVYVIVCSIQFILIWLLSKILA